MVLRIPFQFLGSSRLNYSLCIYDNIENVTEYISFQEDIRPLMFSFYGTVVVFGTLGNVLVITTVLCDRYMRRKATYMFICNLAITDVMFLLISLPLFLVAPAHDSWTLGRGWCKAAYYFEHLYGLNSVFTLVGLSADRLYGTLYPIKSKKLRSQCYAIAICTGTWTLSAFICTSNISSFDTAVFPTNDNSTVTFCLLNVDAIALKIKTVALFLYGYIVPFLVLVIIYYVILLHLSQQRSSSLRTYSSRMKRNQIRLAQRRKVTLLAISIVVVFFVCWFPFHVHRLYRDVAEGPITVPLGHLHVTAYIFMFSNSALNPVIYAFISDDFRKGFIRRCASRK